MKTLQNRSLEYTRKPSKNRLKTLITPKLDERTMKIYENPPEPLKTIQNPFAHSGTFQRRTQNNRSSKIGRKTMKIYENPPKPLKTTQNPLPHSETFQKPIQNNHSSKIGRKNNEIL
jgi:hypothetical protein